MIWLYEAQKKQTLMYGLIITIILTLPACVQSEAKLIALALTIQSKYLFSKNNYFFIVLLSAALLFLSYPA